MNSTIAKRFEFFRSNHISARVLLIVGLLLAGWVVLSYMFTSLIFFPLWVGFFPALAGILAHRLSQEEASMAARIVYWLSVTYLALWVAFWISVGLELEFSWLFWWWGELHGEYRPRFL
ncbi:MAG: hypothetical protein Q8R32_02600 [bacterium]|nr:hypothetical protein [bacterium]